MNLNWLFGALRFFQPVSILYFEQITGNFTAAMGVFSFSCLSQLIWEVPLGVFSDKCGRKTVLILGCVMQFLAVVSYALAGISSIWEGWAWLYLGGALFGFSDACFSGTTHAILYETLAYYKKTNLIPQIIGRNYGMGQAGLAASGLVCASLLWFGFDYQSIVFLTLIPLFFCVLSSALVMEPPTHIIKEHHIMTHTVDALKTMMTDKNIRLLAMAEILKDGTGNTANSFMPQFISQVWPTWVVPLYRFGQNCTGAIVFWQAGKIIDRFNPFRVFISSEISGKFFSLLAYILGSAISPFFLFLNQIGYALGTTSNDGLKQANFTNHQRATLSSLMAFASSLSTAIFALLMGFLADSLSPAWALGTILMIGTPTVWIYRNLYLNHKAVISGSE